MTSCISCCKCNTFIHQGRGEHKWSTPPDIWPNWKKSFWPNQTIYSVIRERGNNYILVDYHYDANNILTSPLINRKVPCILNSIMKIHDKLNKWGLTPKLHIVDNEVSEDLKQYFEIQIYCSNWCSRTTLFLPYALWTLCPPSTYGTPSWPKSPWHSTCCGDPD